MITIHRPTIAEKDYVARIKQMACIVCQSPGPSIAHHIKQTSHYLTLPLCEDCHVGGQNGIHGMRAMWKLRKMDEIDAIGLVIAKMQS